MSVVGLASNYPMLAVLVLVGALGAPLPLNVAVAMAAALARQGRMHISLLFLVCVAAAVAGDCLGYAMGRYGLGLLPRPPRLLQRFQRPHMATTLPSWLQLRMGAVIFLTRWAVTAPAPLVNLAAGARRYGWRRFLLADLSGEALWCVLALAPGYAIGAGASGLVFAGLGALVVTAIGAVLARQLLRYAPLILVRESSRG